jgi:transcription elongation factor Elf1
VAEGEGKKAIGTECGKCGGLAASVTEVEPEKHKATLVCQTKGCGNKWSTDWPPKQIPAEEKRAREKAARASEAKAPAKA